MSLPITAMDKVGVIERVVDFSKTPSAAAEVVPVLDIPAGALVKFVGVEVITAEGATAAGTLGDATDPDGWVAAVNGNAAGFQVTQGAYDGGKFYAAAGTIDHVTTNALDAAVIRYFAEVVNVSGN